MDVQREVEQAERRIRPFVKETPLFASVLAGGPVLLKLENFQTTGSFKLRGAMNRMLLMSEAERARGLVAASSGNHGKAVAFAAAELGVRATVFVPEGASPGKVAAIRELSAKVVVAGDDCVLAECAARRFAEEHDLVYVSPYNDPAVIAGQGTVAVEMLRQGGDFDLLFVAVGGGGLAAGCAGWLKAVRPGVEVIGCLPERSPAMAEAVRAGRVVASPCAPTLSDATAGGLEEGTVTLPLCRELIDDFALVGEDEIAAAMRWLLVKHGIECEGAAGAALAGCLAMKDRIQGRTAGIVICGGNLDPMVRDRVFAASP